MTDIIYDFIATGVDLMLIGSVLAAMIVMMRGSTQLTTLIANQQVVSEEFDYYLQYHMYDNQDGLCAADALSAIVGNRFELIVCINDPINGEIYINNPDDGKYYKVGSTSDGKTMADCANLCTSGTNLSYTELAATPGLSPENVYHANIMTLESGKLQKENFSRDAIIVGLYFERTS